MLDHRKNKAIEKRKSASASLTKIKPLTVWVTTHWKFSRKREYQTTLPASREACLQEKKQQLEPDMKQTGSELGKEYIKAVYCHPALFNLYAEYIIRNPRIKIARRNINNFRYTDDTILMAESEELKRLLIKVKEDSEKTGLKLNIQETKIMASSPVTSCQIDGGDAEKQCQISFSWAPKSMRMVTTVTKLKDTCSLEK